MQTHNATRATRSKSPILIALLALVVSMLALSYLAGSDGADAAATTLVPNGDNSNDSNGWEISDGANTDCGSSGTLCSSRIDEDIDSPNDATSDSIRTESTSPNNDDVVFNVSDAPGNLAVVTGMTVRYRAYTDDTSNTTTVLVSVLNGGSTLGSPSATTLNNTSAQEFSYNLSGLSLSQAQVNALTVEVEGSGNAHRVFLTALNLDLTYSTPTPTPSPTHSPTPTPSPSPTKSPTPTPTPSPSPTPSATPITIVPNPTLPQSCGVDMVIVIDRSSSIDNGELTQMKSAMNGFVDAFLPATPTQIAVIQFGTSVQLLEGFSNDAPTLHDDINGIPVAGFPPEYTNWAAALYGARGIFPNRTNPDLIVFASDGNPTARFGYAGYGPVDINTGNEALMLASAIPEANAAKLAGTRIVTIGIGNDLDVANLNAISSPDATYHL